MDETVARCMLLAKVLAADGETTGTEHAFLERAMNKLSLDEADRERVSQAYARAGVRADVFTFDPDLPARYRRADLALCRSGADRRAKRHRRAPRLYREANDDSGGSRSQRSGRPGGRGETRLTN